MAEEPEESGAERTELDASVRLGFEGADGEGDGETGEGAKGCVRFAAEPKEGQREDEGRDKFDERADGGDNSCRTGTGAGEAYGERERGPGRQEHQ